MRRSRGSWDRKWKKNAARAHNPLFIHIPTNLETSPPRINRPPRDTYPALSRAASRPPLSKRSHSTRHAFSPPKGEKTSLSISVCFYKFRKPRKSPTRAPWLKSSSGTVVTVEHRELFHLERGEIGEALLWYVELELWKSGLFFSLPRPSLPRGSQPQGFQVQGHVFPTRTGETLTLEST